MLRVLCLVIGYFIGCFQTAYLTGKKKANIDIRDYGSGNAGTTNIARKLGIKTGIFVFAIDVLKAVVSFHLCAWLFRNSGADNWLLGFYAGLGVILGHNFPVFLNFKGGKGIASSLGIIACVDWRAALIIYAAGFFVIMAWRYIALGSIVMLAMFPVLVLVFGGGAEKAALAFLFTALAIYQHKGNIQRLLGGTERKFDFSKKAGGKNDSSDEAGSGEKRN